MQAAFFDMDHTVLTVNSGKKWLGYLRRRGRIGRFELLRAYGWYVQYKLAVLDMDTLSQRLVGELAGQSEADMIAECEAWYGEDIEPFIAAGARDAIARHRKAGDRVVLLTSATPYVSRPLSATLGLDDYLCTRLEVSQGKFTGRVVPPTCYGGGKVHHAEEWSRRSGVDLARSSFYTDSYTDLPMLKRVGRPVCINPDPRLARHARRAGWPIHAWETT
jgi:HAD superfamily hydrolase (TIGR01490 family)